MQQRRRGLSPRLGLLASVVLVFGACGTAASPSPSTSAAASAPPASAPASQASASEAPYDGMVYPETGEAPCGQDPYTGTIKKISALDRLTVEFQLCAPDPAFLAKVAFSVFGIQDADYLAKHAPDKSILEQPNGTGPYKLKAWDKGNRITFEANPDYWGEAPKTPNLEFRWSDQAASRLLELQSGNVDGIDNPGTDDIDTIKADSSLAFFPREGYERLLPRHEQHDQAVGQRGRPQGHRPRHRPQADRRQLLSGRIGSRDPLHAVLRAVRLRRRRLVRLRRGRPARSS
jgi:hypothetical protein